jgi:hypothetical protein
MRDLLAFFVHLGGGVRIHPALAAGRELPAAGDRVWGTDGSAAAEGL